MAFCSSTQMIMFVACQKGGTRQPNETKPLFCCERARARRRGGEAAGAGVDSAAVQGRHTSDFLFGSTERNKIKILLRWEWSCAIIYLNSRNLLFASGMNRVPGSLSSYLYHIDSIRIDHCSAFPEIRLFPKHVGFVCFCGWRLQIRSAISNPEMRNPAPGFLPGFRSHDF